MNRTEICNLALSYLAKGKIITMDEKNAEAKQCLIHYDHVRRRLLRAHPWGFARKVAKLALLDDDIPGYEYTYAYPADALFVRFVFDENHAKIRQEEQQDFEVCSGTSREIATNVELAYCEYIADTTNTDLYSEEFVEAFARLLAADMAPVLNGSTDLQKINYDLAMTAVAQARVEACREEQRETRYPHKYADSRFR